MNDTAVMKFRFSMSQNAVEKNGNKTFIHVKTILQIIRQISIPTARIATSKC